MLTSLRVNLAFRDADVGETWLDALDDRVLLVDDDPDVRLADQGAPDAVPTVLLTDAPSGEAWAAQLPPDTAVDTVCAALWAVHHGLVVLPGPSAGPALTPREQEVLELLALGLSNREIGDALQISSHTAKFHVQGLLEKLDATTRTEAAVRAARLFLV
ncbi:MAG: response regulator transcription factor [Myxococcales bacterium]|nr:response regulator transcription factor [Myxococcales bacterium]MCB9669706.1 response regulator transcription factor [Alphaproteobacteria bacterium]